MAQLKKLSSFKKLTSAEGFHFGLGFWLAWACITLIFIPGVACLGILFLTFFGQMLQGLLP